MHNDRSSIPVHQFGILFHYDDAESFTFENSSLLKQHTQNKKQMLTLRQLITFDSKSGCIITVSRNRVNNCNFFKNIIIKYEIQQEQPIKRKEKKESILRVASQYVCIAHKSVQLLYIFLQIIDN